MFSDAHLEKKKKLRQKVPHNNKITDPNTFILHNKHDFNHFNAVLKYSTKATAPITVHTESRMHFVQCSVAKSYHINTANSQQNFNIKYLV